jgi:hypothetical protein
MSALRPARGGALVPVLLVLLAGGLFAWLLVSGESLPDEPMEVIWDKSPCAECSMHVGDPAFAAQAVLQDGTVLYFDDPGCWFLYEPDLAAPLHRAWFHHVREDRWLPLDRVAFAPADDTPMGFGIGAVESGTAGAMTPEEARRQVLER